MKILIIAATANDVFIYNMCKWLKLSMNVEITVIEARSSASSNQLCNTEAFANVRTIQGCGYCPKNIHLKSFFEPIVKAVALKGMIKNEHYDIIHIQRVMLFTVFCSFLKKHCNKLYVTFWGGELDNDKLFRSQSFFRLMIRRFIKNRVDAVVNSSAFFNVYKQFNPHCEKPFYPAILGSAPLQNLYELLDKESRSQAKNKFGIEEAKLTLLLGYSGKNIHNHIPIISELTKHKELKAKIHLLAPMTRGASQSYISEVENQLQKSGYSYSLFKDCFFSDEEIARLRLATDVVFQFSEYDGFSRSIIECFCAKSLVIYGSWLQYDEHLQEESLFAIPYDSIAKGVEFLEGYNHSQYNNYLEKNSLNCRKNIWSECIKDWVNVYNGTAISIGK